MEEPSLLKEIGKFAWFMAKVMGCGAAVIGAVFVVFRGYPIAGALVLYGLLLAGVIVFVGWKNYQRKRKDLVRQKEWEERFRAAGQRAPGTGLA